MRVCVYNIHSYFIEHNLDNKIVVSVEIIDYSTGDSDDDSVQNIPAAINEFLYSLLILHFSHCNHSASIVHCPLFHSDFGRFHFAIFSRQSDAFIHLFWHSCCCIEFRVNCTCMLKTGTSKQADRQKEWEIDRHIAIFFSATQFHCHYYWRCCLCGAMF